MDKQLSDLMCVGVSFSVYYYEGNINNQRYHIRAIVDQEYIVVRSWAAHRRVWEYEIKHAYWLRLLLIDGRIQRVQLTKG